MRYWRSVEVSQLSGPRMLLTLGDNGLGQVVWGNISLMWSRDSLSGKTGVSGTRGGLSWADLENFGVWPYIALVAWNLCFSSYWCFQKLLSILNTALFRPSNVKMSLWLNHNSSHIQWGMASFTTFWSDLLSQQMQFWNLANWIK